MPALYWVVQFLVKGWSGAELEELEEDDENGEIGGKALV